MVVFKILTVGGKMVAISAPQASFALVIEAG
jgi:hypothetical protein